MNRSEHRAESSAASIRSIDRECRAASVGSNRHGWARTQVRVMFVASSILITSATGVADDSPSPAAPSPPSQAAPRPAAPPTLDDLLGITPPGGGAGQPAPSEAPGSDRVPKPPREGARRERLDRALREEELKDTFEEAVASMRGSMERLGVHQDPGIETQRMQEDAVRRLDALIDAARRMRQQQQQQSQSQRDQQQQQQQQQDQAEQEQQQAASRPSERRQDAAARREARQNAGREGEAEPPELQEGALNEVMEEGRVEWGSLPPRIRDLVQQGRRDRVSSLYLRLTEEYYRRMAEEASR
ncbi:MAG: hypothetical protein KF724_00030 [Phycisphaeraceae bacterium]|nr:hypothetical protein [Phycisphaeraceae bacterium]